MMRYDLRRNLRVVPVGGRRPPRPGAPQPVGAQLRIDALDEQQQRIVAASLVQTHVPFQLGNAALDATVPAREVAALAARWQARAATHALGTELAAAWEALPGSIAISGRRLSYARRALVMGVINITPDSFYPASRRPDAAEAADAAARMGEQGADLVDLGGESTRPGAAPVCAEEEIRRVVPAVAAVAAIGGPPVSIDTSKAAVAAAALDAGAVMVNDVCGLRDPELRRLVAERRVPAVINHLRGSPRTMQRNVAFGDTVGEVVRELKQRINDALDAGIEADHLIVDPGIGFGKRVADNLRLLDGASALRALAPVLVGVSRKSFLGSVLGDPVEDRLAGTMIANTVALLRGADIVRVHDVAAAVRAVRFVAALHDAHHG